MTGLNQERTGEQVFRTAATSSAGAGLTDKSQYSVSYHWDGTRTDLNTVDIVFSKSLLNNPNCLEFIKVTGSEARVTTGDSSRKYNFFIIPLRRLLSDSWPSKSQFMSTH